MLFVTAAAFGQERQTTLSGVVKDAAGESLIGVSVAVKGTAIGTTTNIDGLFSLAAPVSANSVLVFTYVGMITQEIPVGSQRVFNVTMKEDATQLEEVVVTGFQNLDKRTFTGSTVKIKADDLISEGMSDISRMLEGKAAGVSIQNVSGTFGAAPKLRIRGATSIYGNNKPLWVIDGVVLEDIVNVSNDQLASGDPTTLLGSAVAGLNANDIENIDILKDASATALYGARAMNGVIVVTTKKGKEGKPQIAYSGNFFIRQKPLYSDYSIMDSWSQMAFYTELENRKGFITSSILNNSDSGIYGKMYQMISNFQLDNTVEAKRDFLMRYAMANTNWFDVLFRNTIVSEHSLSVSSGSENARSYASVSFYDDPGWTLGESVKRYTAKLRNDYKMGSRLDLAFDISANYREQKNPGTLTRSDNVVSGEYTRDFDINPFSYAINTSRALTAYDENGNLEYFQRNYAPFNIINELENNNLNVTVMDIKLQGEATVKLTKALNYSFMGNIRYVKSEREHLVKENSNMPQAYRANGNSTIISGNRFLYADPDNPNSEKLVVLPDGGFYNTTDNLLRSYDVRNQLNYKNSFNDLHDLSFVTGIQIQGNERKNRQNTGYGYQYESGGLPSYDYHILKMMLESGIYYYGMDETRYRFAAAYANTEYTYDMRYALSGTARYEGSNLAGSTARWLLTWNVGFRWNMMEEKFMKPLSKWVDHMNIRTSYGLSAQAPERGNSSTIYYNENAYRPMSSGDAESVIAISSIGNTGLTWEKSYQFNVGYNVSLFNNRIDFMVEYWRKNNYDLLDRIQTSYISGDWTRYANYSDLESHGWEFTLGLVPVNNKNFSWRINLPFGYNTSEITRMEYKPRIYDLTRPEGGNIVGYPLRSLFSVQFIGLDGENGLPRFIDHLGGESYGIYMQNTDVDTYMQYLKYEGSVDPTFTGGFNNTIRYKDFTLNTFITYQGGNKIRLYSAFKASYSDLDALPNEFKDRWTVPGDERYTNVPALWTKQLSQMMSDNSFTGVSYTPYPYQAYNASTVRVADGGFVRLKTVSLTWALPRNWLARTGGVKNASLSLSGNNILMLYADKRLDGQDPEFYNAGGVAQPLQRQYIISLKVGF
jgi:TonB-linked SusC/RagA family outer membrane protein